VAASDREGGGATARRLAGLPLRYRYDLGHLRFFRKLHHPSSYKRRSRQTKADRQPRGTIWLTAADWAGWATRPCFHFGIPPVRG
jgi:hypothetical protein